MYDSDNNKPGCKPHNSLIDAARCGVATAQASMCADKPASSNSHNSNSYNHPEIVIVKVLLLQTWLLHSPRSRRLVGGIPLDG